MPPIPQSSELRVFISSTLIRSFGRGRDLQEEGEHLVKTIFPEMLRPSAGVARCVVIAAAHSPTWT